MTTKYARTVPRTLTPMPTPRSNIKVELISSGRRFSEKCPQSSVPGNNQAEHTTIIGKATENARKPIKIFELFCLILIGLFKL
jgi:hypothetical protein